MTYELTEEQVTIIKQALSLIPLKFGDKNSFAVLSDIEKSLNTPNKGEE